MTYDIIESEKEGVNKMNRQEEAKKVMEEADLLVSGEEIVNSIKKMVTIS